MNMNICIFGSYLEQNDETRSSVIRLGRLLGQKGYTIVSGGFGGIMEYISQGAKEAGGKTIGVTFYKKGKKADGGPNQYIDEEVITDSVLHRIERMIELSDAFIAFPGGTGTLLELATILEFKNKRLMPDKPLILVGYYWQGILKTIEPLAPNSAKLVRIVEGVDEVEGAIEQSADHSR